MKIIQYLSLLFLVLIFSGCQKIELGKYYTFINDNFVPEYGIVSMIEFDTKRQRFLKFDRSSLFEGDRQYSEGTYQIKRKKIILNIEQKIVANPDSPLINYKEGCNEEMVLTMNADSILVSEGNIYQFGTQNLAQSEPIFLFLPRKAPIYDFRYIKEKLDSKSIKHSCDELIYYWQ